MLQVKRFAAAARPPVGGQRRLAARHKRGRQGGAAIVELALTLILFLVVVFTLLEFGRMMWTYSTLAHLTRQAGRVCAVRGSVNPITHSEVHTLINAQAPANGLIGGEVGVYTYWNDVANPAEISRGDFVEVRLTYPFQFLTASLVAPNSSIKLSSTTRMVVAN